MLGFSIYPHELAPFIHPPFLLPVLALISSLDYVAAFHAWAAIMIVLYSLGVWLLVRTVPRDGDRAVLLVGNILFFPAFVSILNGQDTALLLFGVSIWLCGLRSADDRLAGIGLALTAIRPHIALLLALPFLLKHRGVLYWFLGGAALLGIYSIGLVGIHGIQDFMNILNVSASGDGYKTNEIAMLNLLGLLRRLFPAVPEMIARLVGWFLYGLAVIWLCIIWARSARIEEKHIGWAVIIALFAVPHLHYHDLALLLVPIYCLICTLRRLFPEHQTVTWWPLGISWILLPSYSLPALRYSLPYLLGILLWFLLWKPEALFRDWRKVS